MTTAPGSATAPLRVLLVEDNPFHLRLVSSMALEAFDGNVALDHVGSLEAALARLSEFDYDCLLLDLMLPDAVGLEGLHAVLDKKPGLAVIVVSAHDDEDTAVRCVEEGAEEYLVKGVADEQQLKLAILHSIERSGRSGVESSFTSRSGAPGFGHAVLDPSGAITGVDQAVCSMLGRRSDELVGSRIPVHADDRDEVDAAVRERADSDEAVFLRARLLGAGEVALPVDIQLAAVLGLNGGRPLMMQVSPAAAVASSATVAAPAEVGWRAAG